MIISCLCRLAMPSLSDTFSNYECVHVWHREKDTRVYERSNFAHSLWVLCLCVGAVFCAWMWVKVKANEHVRVCVCVCFINSRPWRRPTEQESREKAPHPPLVKERMSRGDNALPLSPRNSHLLHTHYLWFPNTHTHTRRQAHRPSYLCRGGKLEVGFGGGREGVIHVGGCQPHNSNKRHIQSLCTTKQQTNFSWQKHTDTNNMFSCVAGGQVKLKG